MLRQSHHFLAQDQDQDHAVLGEDHDHLDEKVFKEKEKEKGSEEEEVGQQENADLSERAIATRRRRHAGLRYGNRYGGGGRD